MIRVSPPLRPHQGSAMTDIAPARLDDIPAIMALERGVGYEHVVGRWSAEQHAAEMALPGSHYLVARDAERRAARLRHAAAARRPGPLRAPPPHRGGAAWRRPGRRAAGCGFGPCLQGHAVAPSAASRLSPRMSARGAPIGGRASSKKASSVTFRRLPDGRFRSMLMMSILRPEWEARILRAGMS